MPKHIVYFLGAGCSKNFGYPLTGEIMPEILRNLHKKDLFQLHSRKTNTEKQQEKDLLRYINLLYPGLKDQKLKIEDKWIPSITEVLSMVDHLCLYNIPPHPRLDEVQLSRFRYLLNRAVAELLMDYQNMPFRGDEFGLLKEFMGPIIKEEKHSNISIITTNYDLSIDHMFKSHIRQNRIDYGISYRGMDANGSIIPQPINPVFRYYKLHGSLNWLKCELCGQYYIHHDGTIAHQAFREVIDEHNTCACNDHLKLKSVLVAPSLVRDIRDSNLLQIWKASTEAIRRADQLVFIGYSLPGEDLAIKSVIMRGLNGRPKSRPLDVEIVSQGSTAKQPYSNLFGRNIRYYEGGLRNYLDHRKHIN